MDESVIDPAKLAQMDRERALFDSTLDKLIDAYREIQSQSNDGTVAVFDLMEAMAHIESWKLMATLAVAVERLSCREEVR